MKTISATVIVALMTVSVGLAAAAPAMAQEAKPRFQHHLQHSGGPNQQGHAERPGQDGPGRGGMLGGLLDFGRDSERLEIALVRLAHRIDLTDEQKALLATFKTAAIAAQADFAGVLDAVRPAAPAVGTTAPARPDMVARLDQRIALEKAHVDALTAVQPSFEAFFTSLTDEQKAQLMPQRDQRHGWQDHRGPGPMGQPGKRPMPGQAEELNGAGAPPDAAVPTAPTPGQIDG